MTNKRPGKELTGAGSDANAYDQGLVEAIMTDDGGPQRSAGHASQQRPPISAPRRAADPSGSDRSTAQEFSVLQSSDPSTERPDGTR
jgi:hypothetical protein